MCTVYTDHLYILYRRIAHSSHHRNANNRRVIMTFTMSVDTVIFMMRDVGHMSSERILEINRRYSPYHFLSSFLLSCIISSSPPHSTPPLPHRHVVRDQLKYTYVIVYFMRGKRKKSCLYFIFYFFFRLDGFIIFITKMFFFLLSSLRT